MIFLSSYLLLLLYFNHIITIIWSKKIEFFITILEITLIDLSEIPQPLSQNTSPPVLMFALMLSQHYVTISMNILYFIDGNVHRAETGV